VAGDSYRLHPLVRSTFNEILREQLSDSELTELYGRVALYYLEQDDFARAIDRWLEAEAYDEVLNLMKNQWFRLVVAESHVLVADWLELIPESYRSTPSYIQVRSGLLSICGEFRQLSEYAGQVLEQVDLEDGSYLLGTLWHSHHHGLVLTQPGPHYERIRQSWADFESRRGPFPPAARSGVHDMLGLAAFNELRMREALAHVGQALELNPLENQVNSFRYRVLVNMLGHELGDTEPALAGMTALIEEARQSESQSLLPNALVFTARILAYSGRFNQALSLIDECRGAVVQSLLFYQMMYVHLDRYEAFYRLYNGEIEAGLRLLEDSLKRAKENHLIEYATAELVLEYYREATDGSYRSGPVELPAPACESEHLLHYCFLQAWRAFRQGRTEAALTALKPAEAAIRRNGLRPWLVSLSLFKSYFLHRCGDDTAARLELKLGLATLKEIKWHNYPLANSEVTTYAIARSTALGIEDDIVDVLAYRGAHLDLEQAFGRELTAELPPERGAVLLRRAKELNIRGLQIKAMEMTGSADQGLREAARSYLECVALMPLPRLEVRVFGGLNVEAGERLVRFDRVRARDLFAWLLAEHPQPLNEEVIMETFWPEADPKRSRSNLQTTVSSLRKALDPTFKRSDASYVVSSERQYRLNLPDASRVDFMEFERLHASCSDSDTINGVGEDRFRRDAIEALRLYRASAFAELPYADYLQERRDSLEHQYLNLVRSLCERLLAAGDYVTAEQYLRQALTDHPLWEDGVGLLMLLYLRWERTIYALRLYRQYERRLAAELSLEPGENLQALLEKIQSG
jgi:DNA-binding SARP family transcriptional activator